MSDRIALIRHNEELQRQLEDLRRRYVAISNELVEAKRQLSDQSWVNNPDRSGGAFTADELADMGWK